MRISKEQLEQIKKDNGVDVLYSYSRISTYHTSPFSYYLKYIKHEKEIEKDSIYTYSGNAAHGILEQLYEKKIKFKEMSELFDRQLSIFELSDLKFNRSDEEKNARIKNKYNDCLKHFFKNHVMIPGENVVESFALSKIDNYVFQGYIDLLSKTIENDEEIYTVYDFKTSTRFSASDMLSKSDQLYLYALSLVQKGVDINNIRCAYDFLKYTSIKYTMKNGKEKIQDVERNQLGQKLTTSLKTKLRDAGYSADEIQAYLDDVILSNSLDPVPDEIKSQYDIRDCIVYLELNQETLQSFVNKMHMILDDLTERENKTRLLLSQGKEIEAENLWWDSKDLLKQNSYFHINLSGYNRKQHKPWDRYCKMLEDKEKNKDNPFWEEPTDEELMSRNAVNLFDDIEVEAEPQEKKPNTSWMDMFDFD